MVATGVNPYFGELSQNVYIYDASDISDFNYRATCSDAGVGNGVFYQPDISLTFLGSGESLTSEHWHIGRWLDANGNALEGEPTEPGTYSAVIEGIGEYHGALAVGCQVLDYSDLGVGPYAASVSGDVYLRDGKLTIPEVYVWYSDSSGDGFQLGSDCWEITGWRDAAGNALEGEPTEPGDYQLVIGGRGEYHGELTASCRVGSYYDLGSGPYYALASDVYLRDGEPLTPEVSVFQRGVDGSDVELGTDFWGFVGWRDSAGNSLEGDPAEPGDYQLVLEGRGAYSGELTTRCRVLDYYDLGSGTYYASVSGAVYLKDGKLAIPDISVYWRAPGDSGVELGSDCWELTGWRDAGGNALGGEPTEPGEYQLSIEGRGDYRGELTASVSVGDYYDLGSGPYQINTSGGSYLRDGEFVAPEISVLLCAADGSVTKLGDDCWELASWRDAEGNDLVGEPTEPGEYQIALGGRGDYHGELVFLYHVGDYYDLGSGPYSANILKNAYLRDGIFVDPEVLVRLDGSDTVLDDDCWELVGWRDAEGNGLAGEPTEPGVYWFVIEGRGEYHGELATYCQVGDCYDLGSGPYYASVGDAYLRDGKFVAPDVSVWLNGSDTELSTGCWGVVGWKGPDGILIEGEPAEPGNYQIILGGQGAYRGELAAQCRVVDYYDLGSGAYSAISNRDGYLRNGELIAPDISVYLGTGNDSDAELGSDYWEIIGWRDSEGNALTGEPAEPGRYWVVVAGRGNYHGELVVHCNVGDYYDLGSGRYSAFASDKGYLRDGEFIAPKITVYWYDSDGSSVALGSDCWQLAGWRDSDGSPIEGEPTELGEYRAVLEGCDDYHGELTAYVRVLDYYDLGSGPYRVSAVGACLRDGEFVAPKVSVILNGSSEELGSDCWQLVGWRDAEGNGLAGEPIGPGDYQLVVRGCGGYRGELTASVSVGDYYDLGSSAHYIYTSGVYLKDGELVGPRVSVCDADDDVELSSDCWELAGWQDAEGNALAGEPTGLGEYQLVLEGRGDFYGERVVSYDVTDYYNLGIFARCWANVGDAYFRDGGLVGPEVHVFSNADDGAELGADCWEIAGWQDAAGSPLEGEPTEPGDYQLVIAGCGDYYGEWTVFCRVVDYYDLGSDSYYASAGDVYLRDGALDAPQVSVYQRVGSGSDVELNTDCWEIAGWRDAEGNPLAGEPAEPGDYQLVVEGRGGYYGELSISCHVVDYYDLGSGPYYAGGLGDVCLRDGELAVPEISIYDHSDNGAQLGADCWEMAGWRDPNGALIDGAPTEPGEYQIVVEGRGDYHGELTISCRVVDYYDLGSSHYWVSANGPAVISDGSLRIPEFNVHSYWDPTDSLLDSNCYSLIGWQDSGGNSLEGDPTGAGTYQAVLEGRGDYYGTLTCSVDVREGTAHHLTSMTLDEAVDVKMALGVSQSFQFTAPEDGYYEFGSIGECSIHGDLYADSDFSSRLAGDYGDGDLSIVYQLTAGQTVYLKIGTYSAESTNAFQIKVSRIDTNDIGSSYFHASTGSGYVWDDKVFLPNVVLYEGPSSNTTLLEWRDYTVSWADASGVPLDGSPVEAGTYLMVLTGIGDYRGTREIEVTISSSDEAHDLSSNRYSVHSSDGYMCPGKVQKPTISVFKYNNLANMSGESLVRGRDYSVVWHDANGETLESAPVNPGSYSVTVEGIAPYHGSKTLDVQVRDYRDIGLGNWNLSGSAYVRDGEFSIGKIQSGQLGLSIDSCSLTWIDSGGNELTGEPAEPGTYTLRLDGVGEAYGSKTLTIVVNDWYDMEFGSFEVASEAYVWGDKFVTPELRSCVDMGGAGGVSGNSYTYRPTNAYAITGWLDSSMDAIEGGPSEAGQYYAVVEGRGDYYGTCTVPVSVGELLEGDLSSCTGIMTPDSYAVALDGELYSNRAFSVVASDGTRLDETDWRILGVASTLGGEIADLSDLSSGGAYLVLEGQGGWSGRLDVHTILDVGYDRSANYFDIGLDGNCAVDDSGLVHFSYTGNPIEAHGVVTRKAYVSALYPDYTPRKYVEGMDYKVELSETVGSPDESVLGVATITGLGVFTWEKTIPYVIDAQIDLSNLAGSVTLTDGHDSFAGDEAASFSCTGNAVTPAIFFSGQAGLTEGVDYEVSYTNDAGVSITPVETGSYTAIVSAVPGGRLKGSLSLDFELRDTGSLEGTEVAPNDPLLPNGMASGNLTLMNPEHRDDWSFGGLLDGLVEGFDYVVDLVYVGLFGDIADDLYVDADGNVAQRVQSSVYPDATNMLAGVLNDVYGRDYGATSGESGTWKYVISGLNGYEGSTSTIARDMLPQEDFSTRTVTINGTAQASAYSRPWVYADADGNVSVPSVLMDGLTEGVDYELVGIGDPGCDLYDDSLYSWALPGRRSDGQLRIRGLGYYEGCTRVVPVSIGLASGPSEVGLSSGSIQLAVTNAWALADGRFALRRDETPEVRVVDGRSSALLREGADYSLAYQASGDTCTITVTAIDGSGYTGSRTVDAALTDAYDVALAAAAVNGQSVQGDSPLRLVCYGIGIDPLARLTASIGGNTRELAGGTDFTTTLLDSAGNQVDRIESAGSYTLRITGCGTWTGQRDISLLVGSGGAEEAPMRLCTVELSEPHAMYALGSEPAVTVSYGKRVLERNVDYTVEYRNNDAKGNACIVVTAAEGSGFTGQAAVNYKVAETYDLSRGAVLCWVDASGAVLPVSASDGALGMPIAALGEDGTAELELKVGLLPTSKAGVNDAIEWLDRDSYEVTYGNNTEAGKTAWVTVTGRGEYSGKLSGNFKVVAVADKPVDPDKPDPDVPSYDKTPEGYARMLYAGLLGVSEPSEYQVSWWAGRLSSEDAAKVVADFAATPAFSGAGHSPESAARMLYAALLGVSEPSEFQVSWWADIIESQGIVQAVSQMCAGSAFEAVRGEYGLGSGSTGPVDPDPDEPAVYDKTPEGYARMLYGELLGNSSPSDYQVSWWTNRLTSEDPATVISEFCGSDAFVGAGYPSTEIAHLLYAAVLGNASPTDYQVGWWAGVVDAQGVAAAVSQMCQSDAFKAVREAYGLASDVPDVPSHDKTPEGYARMLYGELLGVSEPSEYQVSWWAGRLSSEDAAKVVADFASTPAFAGAGLSSEQVARMLYAGLLGISEPSEYQVNWWASVVEARGIAQAVSQMCTGGAFEAVRAEYGLGAASE